TRSRSEIVFGEGTRARGGTQRLDFFLRPVWDDGVGPTGRRDPFLLHDRTHKAGHRRLATPHRRHPAVELCDAEAANLLLVRGLLGEHGNPPGFPRLSPPMISHL